jgi:hypothetical protein
MGRSALYNFVLVAALLAQESRPLQDLQLTFQYKFREWMAWDPQLEAGVFKMSPHDAEMRIDKAAEKAEAFARIKVQYHQSLYDENRRQLEALSKSSTPSDLKDVARSMRDRERLLDQDLDHLRQRIKTLPAGSIRKAAEEEEKALTAVQNATNAQLVVMGDADRDASAVRADRAKLVESQKHLVQSYKEQLERVTQEQSLWRQYYLSLKVAAGVTQAKTDKPPSMEGKWVFPAPGSVGTDMIADAVATVSVRKGALHLDFHVGRPSKVAMRPVDLKCQGQQQEGLTLLQCGKDAQNPSIELQLVSGTLRVKFMGMIKGLMQAESVTLVRAGTKQGEPKPVAGAGGGSTNPRTRGHHDVAQ